MKQNSFSASLSMPQKNLKKLYKTINPPTKPENLKYPNKKRKWRIKKKWFNRYEKQSWIGKKMIAEDKNGNKISMEIISVRLNTKGMIFTAKPIIEI